MKDLRCLSLLNLCIPLRTSFAFFRNAKEAYCPKAILILQHLVKCTACSLIFVWSLIKPSDRGVLIFWPPVEREYRGARVSKEKRTWPKHRETRNSVRAKKLLTLNISRRRFYKLQAKIN